MADKYSRIKPEPCKGCRHHDWDSKDEYSPIFHYCKKGLFLPTSESCKRKEPFRSENNKHTDGVNTRHPGDLEAYTVESILLKLTTHLSVDWTSTHASNIEASQ